MRPYVTVFIGGINYGHQRLFPADNLIVAATSNPGRVHISAGGVGRNIAHNLALLDIRFYLHRLDWQRQLW
jgi:pseudouridine kinase